MINLLDELFNTEFKITKHHSIKGLNILMFFMITILAILARISLFEYASRDYEIFLNPWFDELSTFDGIKGFGASVGDYTPAYIYIMTLLTKIPVDSLITIKIVSCLSDLIGAFVVLLIAYKITNRHSIALVAYTVFLFAPSIIFNSALWGQCDIIFTVFLLICVYNFIKEKPMCATLFFGIALCFKLQAIFLAPLLIILWLRGKMKLTHFLLIPAMYLISIVPAFIMGRPLDKLLTIYITQSSQYQDISLNAPNLYYWIVGEKSDDLPHFAIFLCVAAVLLVGYYYLHNKIEMDTKNIVGLAFLFALMMPFLLPHMHERYFYVADVFAIVYALQFRKRIFVPITVILSSFASYAVYLFGETPIKLEYAAIALLVVLCIVIRDLYLMNSEKSIGENKPHAQG